MPPLSPSLYVLAAPQQRMLPRRSPDSSIPTAPVVPLSSAGESPTNRAVPFGVPARERVEVFQRRFPQGAQPQARPRGKLHLQDRIQAAVHAVREGLVEDPPKGWSFTQT